MSIISNILNAITKGRKIQIKQGLSTELTSTTLDVGEMGLALDTNDVYIGLADGSNLKVNGGGFTVAEIPTASATQDGLMTKSMVTKLSGISSGANFVNVIDELTNTSATSALSAKQGKVLSDKIDNLTKSNVGLSNVDNVKQMPISNGILENHSEKLVTLSSGAINLSLGNAFTHTLSANTTYSITNAKSNVAHSFTLIITQGSTARTITFPSSVKWETTPELNVANKTFILSFLTINGGVTWYGVLGGVY